MSELLLKDPAYIPAMKGLDYETMNKKTCKKVKAKLPEQLVLMPKLNGIRVRWDVEAKCLRTNNGIMVQSCDHVVEQILATKWVKHLPIDGEMYHHDHDTFSFSYINGKVRRKASSPETKFLQFHIFDVALFGDLDFSKLKRLQLIEKMFQAEENLGANLIRVPCVTGDASRVEPYFRECLIDQYEGIMISDATHAYMTGKGKWMWKWKPCYDAEYGFIRLVPALEGRNLSTFASIELRMDDGQTFCCSGLSDDTRAKLFKNPPEPGTPVTIEFGDKSDTGVPIFPRYKDIRYDA